MVLDSTGKPLPQIRVHYERKEIKEMLVDVGAEKVKMNVTLTVAGHYDVDSVVVCVGRNHIPILPSTNPQVSTSYVPGLIDFTGMMKKKDTN